MYFCKVKYISRIIWTLSRSTGHFLDHPDILQTIWILFRSYGYFAHHPDTLQIIQTLFGSYRYFADPLDIFWNIWTLFRSPGSSRYFSYHPDTFRIIWTPCRPSADFLCISSDYSQDHLDVFRMIQIISRYSGHPASQPAKLSGFAKKNLRSTLLIRWRGLCDSTTGIMLTWTIRKASDTPWWETTWYLFGVMEVDFALKHWFKSNWPAGRMTPAQ